MIASVYQEMGWEKNTGTMWHFKPHGYINLIKIKSKLKYTTLYILKYKCITVLNFFTTFYIYLILNSLIWDM